MTLIEMMNKNTEVNVGDERKEILNKLNSGEEIENIESLSEDLFDDIEIALTIVNKTPIYFWLLSERLRDNEVLALKAVTADPKNSIYLSSTLRDNFSIGLEVAKSDPKYIYILSDRLIKDKDIALAAIYRDAINAERHLDPIVFRNEEVAIAFMEKVPLAYCLLPEHAKRYVNVALAAVKKDKAVYNDIPDSIKKDLRFKREYNNGVQKTQEIYINTKDMFITTQEDLVRNMIN